MTQSRSHSFDSYRATLKASCDATRASLEGTARLRTKQLECIDDALIAHTRVVAEINAAKNMEELTAASGKLASGQFESLIAYWNGIFESIGESQADVARMVQTQTEQVRDKLQHALAAAPDAPAPIMAALQPLMAVASSAYALTARATEEAARLAAAQFLRADPAAKRPAKHAHRRSA
jgi:phasin family protein